jgi:hypothetical protein
LVNVGSMNEGSRYCRYVVAVADAARLKWDKCARNCSYCRYHTATTLVGPVTIGTVAVGEFPV